MKINEKLNLVMEKHRGLVTVLTVMFAFIGIILSLFMIYQSKQISLLEEQNEYIKDDRGFSVALDYNNPMITTKDHTNKLKLLYNDIKVENPYIVTITLKNTGIEPITPEDFLRPLTIKINDDIRILDYYIQNSSNKYLSQESYNSFNLEGNILTTNGFFINQSEEVSISFITEKKANNFTVTSRFYGIPEVKIYNNPQQRKDERNMLIENQKKLFEQVKKGMTIFLVIIFVVVIVSIIWFSVKTVKRRNELRRVCLLFGINIDKITERSSLHILGDYYRTCKRLNYPDKTTKEIMLSLYDGILQDQAKNCQQT